MAMDENAFIDVDNSEGIANNTSNTLVIKTSSGSFVSSSNYAYIPQKIILEAGVSYGTALPDKTKAVKGQLFFLKQ